jgi:uncharacterized protein YecE (DUF72 family)
MLRLGTSGFHYNHWRKIYYPEGMPPSRWFEHYAREFDTVELNNPFYRLPSAETFDAWRRQAPAGFLFAVKYSRFGSHIKKLKDPELHVGQFVERASRLAETLGPILVQLPPRWTPDPGRLDAFLEAAPKRFLWTVEFRDPRWLAEEILVILEKHRAALCLHDKMLHPFRLTADWTYLRFHGVGGPDGCYTPDQLEWWARHMRKWLDEGRDVYAYFNNDLHGHALRNARDLRILLEKVHA